MVFVSGPQKEECVDRNIFSTGLPHFLSNPDLALRGFEKLCLYLLILRIQTHKPGKPALLKTRGRKSPGISNK